MRKNLEKLDNERFKVTGTFDRYGLKNGYRGGPKPTILLKDITNEDGEILTEHLWFNLTRQFGLLGTLVAGDKVEFEARVKAYVKGYVNRREYIDERELDYKLSHPTKVRKLI